MSEYRLKPGKVGKKIMNAYQSVEDKFVETFLNEDASMKTGGMAEKASSAYHKIEDTVIGGYKKVEDAFVDTFLEKTDSYDEEADSKK
ncbi:MAG: hypothetical protein KHY46_15565 [Clostridiales bacterium]|nr:hypothetical protein [Clostridiales bacterium]